MFFTAGTSSSPSDEHDESSLIPPVLHDFGVMETTSFSNSTSLKPDDEEKVCPVICSMTLWIRQYVIYIIIQSMCVIQSGNYIGQYYRGKHGVHHHHEAL